jgi:hypothetical protein
MSLIQKLAQNLRVGGGQCTNGHSLMTSSKQFEGENAIKLTLRLAGREGMIYLNPYFGKFEHECNLELKKGDVVELLCPECGVSLSVDTMCNLCNIPMFAVQLPDGGQVEACPKVGCHNHSLKIVDLDAQLDRMYVDETKVQM